MYKKLLAVAMVLLGCGDLVWGQDDAAALGDADVELQTGPLVPGWELAESSRLVHQIRLLVDAKQQGGVLILDGNVPEFDEFGKPIRGIQTPHIRAQGDPALMTSIACEIRVLKTDTSRWRLYEIRSPKIETPLRFSTLGSVGDGGPARFMVLGANGKAVAIANCTRYGLVVPSP